MNCIMKDIFKTLAVTVIVLLIVFIAGPFVMGSLINHGSQQYFMSVVTSVFLVFGTWQMVKGKVQSGTWLLLLSVALFILSRHIEYFAR